MMLLALLIHLWVSEVLSASGTSGPDGPGEATSKELEEADSGMLLSTAELAELLRGGTSGLPPREALEGRLPGRRVATGGAACSLPAAALCWISATLATRSSTWPVSFSHISSQCWNCLVPSPSLPSSSLHLASTRPTSSLTRPVTSACTSSSFLEAYFSLMLDSVAKQSTSFLSALAPSSCLMEFHIMMMSLIMAWTSLDVAQTDTESTIVARRRSWSSSFSPTLAALASCSTFSPSSWCCSCALVMDS
mmetsp:Transcript_51562/g.159640  ORF Transcript_51562/g.159640 Transcript_51562/m.159640 type:complete len:250 (-) Transcript_51562:304-1053(-)